jgi:Activator of Hsp90 ATPase homolog 1-like protein
MVTIAGEETIHTLNTCHEIDIAASVEIAFEAVLEELGPGSEMPDGTPFPMKIEPWPGGRWFRDLGNDTGHLWGHVQVIKPPVLIELYGPMFMSYPAISHVQYRLTPNDDGTRLKIAHRAVGLITSEHREGVQEGWNHALRRIAEIAARRQKEQGGRRP